MLSYETKNQDDKGMLTYNPKGISAAEAKKGATKIDTTYRTEKGNIYDVYRGKDGKYFIVDKNNKVSYFTNPNAIAIFDANQPVTTSKAYYENLKTPIKNPETKPEVKPENNDTAGTGAAPLDTTPVYNIYNTYNPDTDPRVLELLELLKPKSAEELAKKYDIDYNEQNILKDYNERTSKFYDEAIAAQEGLRSDYARNNAQYINNITDSYLNSYANAAPTATGKGTLAANALSTMINASDSLSTNDYGMAQSVNNLEAQRKAELANNPMLAKEFYNDIGLYLSTLSSNLNTSQVRQYVDALDAYSNMYAASRATAAANAAAAATKYAGLANASVNNASSSSGTNSNNWSDMYNYYMNQYSHTSNPDYYTSNVIKNNLLNAGK